jgi:hypothetical protein
VPTRRRWEEGVTGQSVAPPRCPSPVSRTWRSRRGRRARSSWWFEDEPSGLAWVTRWLEDIVLTAWIREGAREVRR